MNDLPRLRENGNWLEKELLGVPDRDAIPKDVLGRLHQTLNTQPAAHSAEPSPSSHSSHSSGDVSLPQNSGVPVPNTNPAIPLQGVGVTGWFGGVIVAAAVVWGVSQLWDSTHSDSTRPAHSSRVHVETSATPSAFDSSSGVKGASSTDSKTHVAPAERLDATTATRGEWRRPLAADSSKSGVLRDGNPSDKEQKNNCDTNTGVGCIDGVNSERATTSQPAANGAHESNGDNDGPAPVGNSSPKDSLAKEVRLLDLVRKALAAGDSSGALHALSTYSKDCDRCVLSFEAELLRVEVLESSGQHAGAVNLASKLLPSAGTGRAAERLKQIIGTSDRK